MPGPEADISIADSELIPMAWLWKLIDMTNITVSSGINILESLFMILSLAVFIRRLSGFYMITIYSLVCKRPLLRLMIRPNQCPFRLGLSGMMKNTALLCHLIGILLNNALKSFP